MLIQKVSCCFGCRNHYIYLAPVVFTVSNNIVQFSIVDIFPLHHSSRPFTVNSVSYSSAIFALHFGSIGFTSRALKSPLLDRRKGFDDLIGSQTMLRPILPIDMKNGDVVLILVKPLGVFRIGNIHLTQRMGMTLSQFGHDILDFVTQCTTIFGKEYHRRSGFVVNLIDRSSDAGKMPSSGTANKRRW